jgi:hypothetical protein
VNIAQGASSIKNAALDSIQDKEATRKIRSVSNYKFKKKEINIQLKKV